MKTEASLLCLYEPATGPVLSQMNPEHALKTHLPNGLFPSGFPYKIVYAFFVHIMSLEIKKAK
jgi:hypothetical protein